MNFRQTALLAAKQASKVLLKFYGKKETIKIKPNKSLVATADLEANKAIIKTIKKYFPKHSILSEESGFENNKSDYRWIIDPLDGTHNFLHQIPFFGTSIALEYRDKVVLGVLHFPAFNATAFAEKGKGAYLNGKRIKVSGKKNLEHSFVLVEFSYSNRIEKVEFLRRLISKTVDVRDFGSAIYNLLLMATGKCDGYVILSTKEWDIAAGFLLVGEAGGKITDVKGKKWIPKGKKFVVSNGRIHSGLLKYVK